MKNELGRVFGYATKFYIDRIKLVVLFSIPFIASLLLLSVSAAPTYSALGAVFLRTGSIPELSFLDILLTLVAFFVSVFIIADSIVNINLITLSKRTMSVTPNEIIKAMESYAIRVFYVFTIVTLVFFLLQLFAYDLPFRSWIYPLLIIGISFFTFFVPPAVVVDNLNTGKALSHAVEMAMKKPVQIFVWGAFGLFLFSAVKLLSELVFPSTFSGYFVILVNSLFVLPFLIILQTQMYMEKYPLAR